MELRNRITEMKNTLEGINSRRYEAEKQINEWEDGVMKITSTGQKKRKNNEMKQGQFKRTLG